MMKTDSTSELSQSTPMYHFSSHQFSWSGRNGTGYSSKLGIHHFPSRFTVTSGRTGLTKVFERDSSDPGYLHLGADVEAAVYTDNCWDSTKITIYRA